MKNMIALLAATTALSLTSAAYAADETVKSKTTTNDGTVISSEKSTDVDVDSNGLVDKTVKSETTTDAKGLMNKKVDNSKTEFKEKKNGGYEQTTTAKHTDAEGTNVILKTTTDVDVDDSGNVTTAAKTEKTVDPKGLMNSKTASTKTKTVNGKTVEAKIKN